MPSISPIFTFKNFFLQLQIVDLKREEGDMELQITLFYTHVILFVSSKTLDTLLELLVELNRLVVIKPIKQ